MITYEPLNRFAFYFPDKPGFLRNLFIILLIHNLFWSHFSYKINKNFSFFLFSFFIFFSFPFSFSLLNSLHRKKQTNLERLEYSRIFSNIGITLASYQSKFLDGRFICLLCCCIFSLHLYLIITFSVPKKAPEYYFSCQKTSGEFRRKRLRNTRKKTVK